MLSVLAYIAVGLTAVSVTRRSRIPVKDPRSGGYVLAITTCSGAALLLWAPSSQGLISHLTGWPLLAIQAASMLQVTAGASCALLRARIAHAAGMPRDELIIAALAIAVLGALLALALMPQRPGHAAAYQILWCTAAVAGYGFYVARAIGMARSDPDHILRTSVRITLINTSLRIAIAVYLIAEVILRSSRGAVVVIGLDTPALLASIVATAIGAFATVIATLASTALGYWVRARARWTSAYWSDRRLRWLWSELTRAVPEVRPGFPGTTLHERLTRRVVEITDAQLHLAAESDPHLLDRVEQLVARGQVPAARRETLLAAAQIRSGIDRRRARLAHDPPAPAPLIGAPRPPHRPADVDETHWLIQVSTELRRRGQLASLLADPPVATAPPGTTPSARQPG